MSVNTRNDLFRILKQRILSILKSITKWGGCNIGFAEYIHRKYPEVDEDIITMIEDILEHPQGS